MKLSADFENRMKEMLGNEYEAFINTYNEKRACGLRINPLKCRKETFLKDFDIELNPVLWCDEGFYYDEKSSPGKHGFHQAGAFYIQEPSAMSAVEILEVEEGEKILDLCAAPGGKTTQIAGKLMGTGLLVANEYYPQRARILSQNIERLGIKNAIVLNEDTESLAERFEGFFDRILVDAPCSGEGMFRKDEEAINEWSLSQVKVCAKRQAEILDNGAKMLKDGGVLVYSTCTFSPEENETVLAEFLEKHKDFSVEQPKCHEKLMNAGFSEGCSNFVCNRERFGDDILKQIKKAYRLWPHKLRGEGHFVVRLKKSQAAGDSDNEKNCGFALYSGKKNRNKNQSKSRDKMVDVKLYREFEKENLNIKLEGKFVTFGEYLYVMPDEMPDIDGIKVERAGLKLGCNKKNRFEPDHGLAMYLKPHMAKQVVELPDSLCYLKGETVPCRYEKGWCLVTTGGYSLGFGKADRGILKNHYPKGLRIK